MSVKEVSGTSVACKICKEPITLKDDQVHFGCYSATEALLKGGMMQYLKREVDSIQMNLEKLLLTIAPTVASSSQPSKENANNNDLMPPPPGLVLATNPVKNVFLSGLATDTTVDHVNKFINNKLGRNVPVKVKKMILRENADHSSFIIYTEKDNYLYEQLINPSIWPPLTIIHQFVQKTRVVRLSIEN